MGADFSYWRIELLRNGIKRFKSRMRKQFLIRNTLVLFEEQELQLLFLFPAPRRKKQLAGY